MEARAARERGGCWGWGGTGEETASDQAPVGSQAPQQAWGVVGRAVIGHQEQAASQEPGHQPVCVQEPGNWLDRDTAARDQLPGQASHVVDREHLPLLGDPPGPGHGHHLSDSGAGAHGASRHGQDYQATLGALLQVMHEQVHINIHDCMYTIPATEGRRE